MEEKVLKEKIKEIIYSERVGFLYAVGDEDLLIEELLNLYQKELDRAREEGKEEGINTVLYPKFRKDKRGNSKRIGWVDTSKLTTK